MRKSNTIEGVIDRVVYSNEDNAWSVVRLTVRGQGQLTAVGNLLGVQPGETLKLTGKWVRNRKYGEQFEVESFLTVKPSTYIGIERYLSSGMVKGIGKTMAKRLVQHFGLETLEIIDRHPERLTEVEGVGKIRSAQILDAWKEQREIRSVMVFLQSHGVSTSHAVKIYKRFGSETIALVRENPYRLAAEVYGIGFKSADKIARDLGHAPDSPHRLEAGVLHVLSEASGDGHVYLPRGRLVEAAAELLEIERGEGESCGVEAAIDRLLERGELASPELGRFEAPELLTGERAIYLTPLEAAEASVAERLRRLTAQAMLPIRLDAGRAVEWFEEEQGFELGVEQRMALEQAISHKVLVITGGPGTGKTTLVRGILSILTKKRLKIGLAAPTGRAAKRLSEATGAEAKTIHRLLEYQPQSRSFARDGDNPLSLDLLVIDEASMLDVVLTHHVLRAVRDETRLIFVGDVDQLPSVGPGRVLADLIDSRSIDVVHLSEIFRQASESLIIVNAHRVRVGAMPILRPEDDHGDFFFFERAEPPAILATLKHLVAERIPGGFGFDPMRDIQVLSPMQRGILGAANLNAELQALLNPEGEGLTRAGRLLRLGDRVMQVRNNYDLDVFNGDLGRIVEIDLTDQRLKVDYDGRPVDYEASDLDELVLAYASSIHKSQGSEYPCVVIPLHTQHFTLLQRNLLYTAITRGQKLVIIVGSEKALSLAVRTETSTERMTLLAQRLRA